MMNFITDKCAVKDLKNLKIDKRLNVRNTANTYRELHNLIEILKEKKKSLESVLKKHNVCEYFIEDKQKVVYQESKDQTELNVKKIFNYFNKEGRINEFLKLVKINESDLSKTEEGQILIAKNKKIIGQTKDSVLVRKMNQTELNQLY